MELMAGYKRTEVGLIPEGWEIKAFGDIAFVRNQKIDPRKSGVQPFCVGLEHIQQGTGQLLGNTEATKESSIKAVFCKDDVLFGKLRAYLRKYWLANRDGVASTEIWPLVSRSDVVLPRYVFQVIQTEGFIEAASMAYGTHMPRTDWNVVKNYPVPLPPLPEQQAIAAALSDVDALISALDKLIAKKRDIKQAAMQQLLTGKKRLPGFSGEWAPHCFEEIASVRKEKIDPKRIGGHSFCVDLEHIEQGSGRLAGYSTATEESSIKARFLTGDVLFGRLRAYLRKYWIADRDGVCSTEIWPLVAEANVVFAGYLFQLIQANQFIDVASTAYGTHMPRSDWNVVKNYTVTLPALAEQKAIATILSDMDAEIAALEQRRDKTRTLKQGMMQELLTGKTRLL